jgi:tRNA 5-methylaminomethyl-2-thiouridine biosynthesis bifunctional protein
VTIIGGGIAGASLAQAFRDLGAPARVIDPRPPGSGASGAPAGLAAARLDAGLGPAAALFAQAARRAAQLYDVLDGAVVARGALQLASGPKDPGRFAAIESSDLFESGQMRRVAGEAATATAGAPLGEGLLMDGARVIRPSAILAAWLGETETAEVATIAPGASGWRLVATTGAELGDADVVCVAAAMVTATLAPGLELMPVRGQITFTTSATWKLATLFGGYVIPSVGGLVFGATHDRNDTAPEARPADRARNLAGLASALPNLAAALQSLPLEDWTAVRATTRDYLPLAGETGDPVTGRLVLTGLGSRGFCLAPLLAEHLAAIALQAPSPLPRSLAALVDPGRFAARASRKGRPRA